MGIELGVGAKAPAFKLPRDGGGSVALKDFKGRGLVLYFYPKTDTPGCTREAIDFTKLHGEFQKAGADVLGVSADPVAAHEMLEAYGVWGKKSMYGRTFMGVIRATFLIGADGRIARVWPKVSVPGHAEEVLAAARALSG